MFAVPPTRRYAAYPTRPDRHSRGPDNAYGPGVAIDVCAEASSRASLLACLSRHDGHSTDYRLTDPHLDPPGLDDRFYSEQSIRLPNAFWVYDPLATEPAVNSLPAQNAYVTFGSLNNFTKVNTDVLKLWALVLKAVDRSRLILLAPGGSARQRTAEFLNREGIGDERVRLVGRRPRQQYLELYQEIDIGLDTFPANGHTTSLDSFWMGRSRCHACGKYSDWARWSIGAPQSGSAGTYCGGSRAICTNRSRFSRRSPPLGHIAGRVTRSNAAFGIDEMLLVLLVVLKLPIETCGRRWLAEGERR